MNTAAICLQLMRGMRVKHVRKINTGCHPLHEPIVVITVLGIILGGAALVGLITYFRKWTWLWTEWLTTVDHKNRYYVHHRFNGDAYPWFC